MYLGQLTVTTLPDRQYLIHTNTFAMASQLLPLGEPPAMAAPSWRISASANI